VASQSLDPDNSATGSPTINVCLMWHSVYLGNLGTNSLTYSMLRYLEDIARQSNIGFAYTVLGYGPRDKNNCWDEVIVDGRKISFKFEQIALPYIDVGRVRGWAHLFKWLVSSRQSFVNALSSYDLVLDIGGGDCFTDIYGMPRFIQASLSKMLTLEAGKTLVLLPQTIGPFHHPLARLTAEQLMRRIEYIYPRDKTSLRYLENAFRNRTFQEYWDVAFYLPYEPVHFGSDRIHVGLNVSGLLWQGGYTQDNMFRLRGDYQKTVRDIIRFFLRKENVLVHLVPHVVTLSGQGREDDYTLAQQIHREMPETVLSPMFRDPIAAKSYISGLDFFAGARMHSCIAAYSSGVPVVPMAYSRKFSGLFRYSLDYPVLADMQSDDSEQVYRKVCDGFEDRQILRQAILDKRDSVEDNIAAFRKELTAIVKRIYETRVG